MTSKELSLKEELSLEQILRMLCDADISPAIATSIMGALRQGQWSQAHKSMLAERARLLADIHAKQEYLFRLDHLLWQLKQVPKDKLTRAEAAPGAAPPTQDRHNDAAPEALDQD